MGTKNSSNTTWAYLLIAGGLVLLAGNLGWFAWAASWLWALLFLGAGGAFLYHYATKREHWWALIPGFALSALGVTLLLGDAGGPFFLALLGAGFLAVHFTDRARWWAVIPGGVLATLAVVAYVEEAAPRYDAGWLFFLGLAATFGYLYLQPEERGKRTWALIPALVAGALALFTLVDTSAGGLFLPLALIAVGAYLIWRRNDRGADKRVDQGADKPIVAEGSADEQP